MRSDTQLSKNWGRLWLLFSIVGIFISLYLIDHHLQLKVFGKTNSACNINSLFNCDRVGKSRFSEVFGVPMGAYGLSYFTTLFFILLSAKCNFVSRSKVLFLYGIFVLVGILVSLALSIVSTIGVKAYCIACMSVYAVTLFQFVSLLVFWRSRRPLHRDFSLLSAVAALILLCLIPLGYHQAESKLLSLTANPKYRSQTYSTLRTFFHMKPKEIPIRLKANAQGLEDIWYGNENAKVVLVDFIDLQCPYCQDFWVALEPLIEEFKDRVLFVNKFFPMEHSCNRWVKDIAHADACQTAQLGICFWKKHAFPLYFKNLATGTLAMNTVGPNEISPLNPQAPIPGFELIARALGLGWDEMQTCFSQKEVLDKIRADSDLGHLVGMRGTPTIYINGWQYLGVHSTDAVRYELNFMLEKSH